MVFYTQVWSFWRHIGLRHVLGRQWLLSDAANERGVPWWGEQCAATNKKQGCSFLSCDGDSLLFLTHTHTRTHTPTSFSFFLFCFLIFTILWWFLPFNNVKSAISSVQFSHSVVSDSLRLHEPQHARPPCRSPTPGVHHNYNCIPSPPWASLPSSL